jgi:hypothetical protein
LGTTDSTLIGTDVQSLQRHIATHPDHRRSGAQRIRYRGHIWFFRASQCAGGGQLADIVGWGREAGAGAILMNTIERAKKD